ncbi:MAG: iron ABC transporter permease [Kiritimatiellaeota bacterium]|nr:iron ABC transporter permease [Kiritimatiellota bacterium]
MRVLFYTLLGLLAALLVAPIVIVVQGGFWVEGHFTMRYLLGVFQNVIYLEGLRNSLFIAVGTTALSFVVAVPLALVAYRYDFPGKRIWTAGILVPMILPPFVGAIGLLQILGPYGALNAVLGCGPVDWLGLSRYLGVILIQSLALYPIVYLNVSAALANVDPAMEEAAANMGASPLRRFFRITLPLITPGLFAGGTIVFIWSFTELGAPLMLNYTQCASVQVYDALKEIGGNPFPYALVTVLLVASLGLYLTSRLLFGSSYAMQAKAAVTFQPHRLRRGAILLATLPFLFVTLVALAPHAGVILVSFTPPGEWYRTVLPSAFSLEHYTAALGHDMTVSSIRNSLSFSLLSVSVNLVLGLAIAWIVVRSRLRFRSLLDLLAMIPLAVPGLVMAFGFLAVSSRLSNTAWVQARPFLVTLFDVRVNPTLFLVIAYAVRRLPYMVRSAVAGLQQTSVAFEEAAANLGAAPWRSLKSVTLPLIAANLIAGLLLCFSFSMLEVSDSLMLAQQAERYPITKTIYELFQLLGTGRHVAAALGVWAMLFLAVTIVGASLMLGKKLGALFRA